MPGRPSEAANFMLVITRVSALQRRQVVGVVKTSKTVSNRSRGKPQPRRRPFGESGNSIVCSNSGKVLVFALIQRDCRKWMQDTENNFAFSSKRRRKAGTKSETGKSCSEQPQARTRRHRIGPASERLIAVLPAPLDLEGDLSFALHCEDVGGPFSGAECFASCSALAAIACVGFLR